MDAIMYQNWAGIAPMPAGIGAMLAQFWDILACSLGLFVLMLRLTHAQDNNKSFIPYKNMEAQ